MKFAAFFTGLFCLLVLGCFAQPYLPDGGKLYSLEDVSRVDIIIHPDSLKEIYDYPESDREYRAMFVFHNNSSNDTVKNIGFRLRGNTSRLSQKKSFKVSFNTFTKGGKFEGVEKLNLNGEHNDPSSSRAVIYWYLLRKMGVEGPRANHVQVYINNNYYGLYTNVEHIDEEFADIYYGNKDGNLYKCLWPADLTYRGTNQADYKFMSGDHRTYELKTNEETDNYSDLVEFNSALNLTPGEDLVCELDSILNIQSFLKIAALDVLTSNWDGYAYNKNNFYLYHNSGNGLFEYIPYDVDNTFGIDWFGIDWSTRNIYSWASDEPRPLFKRLISIPEYKAQYTYYIKELSEIISSEEFLDFIEELRNKSRPFILSDPYYPLDYGYSIQSFDQSWESAAGGHVPFGILSFLEERVSTAGEQSINVNPVPVIYDIGNNQPKEGEDLIIKAKVEDDDLNTVVLSYSINGEIPILVYMYDDGTGPDEIADDGIYTASLKDLEAKTVVDYYIYAFDKSGSRTIKPCNAIRYIFPAQSLPDSYEVWPNPASGNYLNLNESSDIELFDIAGRLLLSKSDTDKINISTLRAGIYLLRINGDHSIKIVIE